MADTSSVGIVVQRDIMVPMRDGIELATDVYLPADAADAGYSLPVIMERTPYDKSGVNRSEKSHDNPVSATRAEVARYFAGHGFAVVMQDCRGRYGSGGVFKKYVNEAQDGVDTLDWVLQQPWCDGHVGTMGVSYGAHVQCALASLNPTGLACMFIDSGGFSSAFHGGIRRGGAFEMKQVTWAYRHALLSPATENDPRRREKLEACDLQAWFRSLPWREGHSPLAAAPEFEQYLFEQWRAGLFSDYWRQPGLFAEGYYDNFPDVPTAIIGSWYDPYVLSCTKNFQELARRHQSPVTLLMGPWTHGDRSVSVAGDVDFGATAILDGNIADSYLALRLQWFNRHLRGVSLPGERLRTGVTYFRMGGGDGHRTEAGRMMHGGQWRQSTTWPPASSSLVTMFLQPDGHLSTASPASAHTFVEYWFDPDDPVPTIGGALTSGEPLMDGGAFDQRLGPEVFSCSGNVGVTPLADRDDVLVFQTDPLEQDVEVCGDIRVKLWISSDCPDTDFTAKLIDWYPPSADYPDGYAMNITDGIFRVRYRDGWDRESFLSPGEICCIVIEPFATSNLFRRGHRIRLDVSSSNYPHFDVNPNTAETVCDAGSKAIATNRVWCSADHPSCILLPIVGSDAEL